jgi:pimeloyl-ACP methyl ester carboxylesterase
MERNWIMKQKVFFCALVFIVSFSIGCSSLWKRNTITIESTSSVRERKQSLIVLFPGFEGEGVDYKEQGFIDTMREQGFEADIMTLNIKPRIYFYDQFTEMFRNDVILPAKSKGYESVYLIGISMGGHGVLLYATMYPEDIESIFVISPFISGSMQSNAILKAGGIENWEDCPFIGWDQACNLWKSLKKYVSDPERKVNMFLGYGNNDVFVKECRILASLLPPENVFTVEGEHDWATWKRLWIIAMDRFKAIKSERMELNRTQSEACWAAQ